MNTKYFILEIAKIIEIEENLDDHLRLLIGVRVCCKMILLEVSKIVCDCDTYLEI